MRHEFPQIVKEVLAKRVGTVCSNTDCGKPTSGPSSDAGKAVNIGVAAHITAASPRGPRFDKKISAQYRGSAENGIWLCQSCAKLVDSDERLYTVTLLREWKARAEERRQNAITANGGQSIQPTEALDFSVFLRSIINEFAQLPNLPNDTKNILLRDIVSVQVQFPPKSSVGEKEGEGKPRFYSLPQAVIEERAWLLVGEGGQGKTTALRFLAYHFAEKWLATQQPDLPNQIGKETSFIPVYFPLSRHSRYIYQQISTAMQGFGFNCPAERITSLVQNLPFLFLIDRLDETDSDDAFDEIFNLLRSASNSRVVIASRPLSKIAKWPLPKAQIKSLTNSEIYSLMKKLLGAKRGGEICDALASNALLEVFQRPLFARMLALSPPELVVNQQLTIGRVFQDVLETQFLRSWERVTRSKVEADLKREITSKLAHKMVAENTYAITRDVAIQVGCILANQNGVQADLRYMEGIIDELVRHGLMEDRSGELQFWHSSFRDYYAAIWLKRHVSGFRIYLRSWYSQWHESLFFYFGNLSGSQLNIRLRQLIKGNIIMISMLSVNPCPSVARRLFLILRCLAQAGIGHASLKRKFIKRLPVRLNHFHLNLQANDYSSNVDGIDCYASYCNLLGQLRIPEAFVYLNRIESRFPTVASGLMYDDGDEIIDRVVRYMADAWVKKDGTTDFHKISRLVVQSPDPRFIKTIYESFTSSGAREKTNLLESLASALRFFRKDHNTIFREALEAQLASELIDLVLYDEDSELRNAAVSLLSAFTGNSIGDLLPIKATDTFFAALTDSKMEVRYRAFLALSFSPLRERMYVVWRLLDDPEIGIVFHAIYCFWILERERFPSAVLRVLRRLAPSGSPLRQIANHLHDQTTLMYPDFQKHKRCVALLRTAAVYGEYVGTQTYAIQALGELRILVAAPTLIGIYKGNGLALARSKALSALVEIIGTEACHLVLEGLNDKDTDVRDEAIWLCSRVDSDEKFRSLAGPKLFQILCDSSETKGNYADFTLRKWGYVGRFSELYARPDIMHMLGCKIVYLGPSVET